MKTTTKNTDENNKLIADFMAGKKVESHHNQYHESWNELMPVIEKILTLKTYVESRQKVFNSIKPNIDITYNSVVEFINRYNENH